MADSTNTDTSEGTKESFYLFDDEQSCRIETIQMAARGIGSLIRDEGLGSDVDFTANRTDIAAIFDLLALSLDDAIGTKNRRHAYLDPRIIKGTVQ